ncbi:GNAT family N-acetyltransferase [Leptothoe spongobia]|uniref:GNAT family N-acetyltransferase n=1 Tax=Leptothoe spongobia TAU-MAC 1115 TaxID=1967444 RepID=A0A947DCR1_9CYAN|nr:GNAT family N-acetyltransferase [Leptothoe spongobia]MBT9314089.1 GNAT family N-acetyltransferase [Leptothoe spongobia TAU-MAC 1115]
MVYVAADPLLEDEVLVRYNLTFRSITEADQPFLKQVYASTREEELAIVPWPEEQKQTFLEFQFNAQHTFYQNQFGDAAFWVIEQAGVPIGRLYLDRRADEIRIIDIALLPAYRDRGIGTALLNTILAVGQANNQPVRIHVEQNNRALNLYRRLGFVQIGGESVYYLMEWTPSDNNIIN